MVAPFASVIQEDQVVTASAPPAMASPTYRLVASVASEAMGIGKSSDVLTVLGGKASCRRKFVLNVHLLDENGNLASKDISIVASVAYAHDHSPVVRDDKPFLAEPPLFTTFNGVEFPAQERPTRMVTGRASFKLAISLLSSKCDNRLFCICFTPQFPADSPQICQPCYSKPIRSISRKRTQSTPLTIPLPAMDAINSPSAETCQKIRSPASSSENDGANSQVPASPRPGSVTSIHYVPPASSEGLPHHHESCFVHSTTSTLGNLSVSVETVADTGNLLCSSKASFDKNGLALRLSSPSLESGGSPNSNSGALTSSESCSIENKDHQSSPKDHQGSPGNLSAAVAPPPTRPFRPYASVGACNIPLSDFQLGISPLSRPVCFPPAVAAAASPLEGPNSPHALLERVQQLRSVSPPSPITTTAAAAFTTTTTTTGKSFGNDNGLNPGLNNNVVAQAKAGGLNEVSLEEEEKSLQYIEVSLQEVNRELQRRKEELRSKRRRLLEDEARMHSIIFQSSSWIESLSGRFSL